MFSSNIRFCGFLWKSVISCLMQLEYQSVNAHSMKRSTLKLSPHLPSQLRQMSALELFAVASKTGLLPAVPLGWVTGTAPISLHWYFDQNFSFFCLPLLNRFLFPDKTMWSSRLKVLIFEIALFSSDYCSRPPPKMRFLVFHWPVLIKCCSSLECPESPEYEVTFRWITSVVYNWGSGTTDSLSCSW